MKLVKVKKGKEVKEVTKDVADILIARHDYKLVEK